MHRSVPYFARFRDLLGRFGRKSDSGKVPVEPASKTEETEKESPDDDLDVLKARGYATFSFFLPSFLTFSSFRIQKYIQSYDPPPDLDNRLFTIVRDYLPTSSKIDDGSLLNLSFVQHGGNDFKFRVYTAAEETFGKRIPSSFLHELKTVGDLLDFYRVPVKIVTDYAAMARARDHLPSNLHIAEEPKRFHPLTDGLTAFPGRSHYITDLRERQFFKGFRAKSAWHEYEDKHFDYDQSPPNCPWDKKKSERYDVINFRIRPEFPSGS